MADSSAFEWLCGELESATALTALESRGTVRIALKQAGLDAKRVSASEARVVIDRVLPGELESRGIPDAAALCARLGERIGQAILSDDASEDSPAAVFERLGG